MNDRPVRIVIADVRFPAWLRLTAFAALLCVGPIGIGALIGSTAMQWVGFIFSGLSFLVLARRDTDRTTFTTIDDARRFLDELERRP